MSEPVERYLRATFAEDGARAPAPADLAGAARRRAGLHQRRLSTVAAATLSMLALVTGVTLVENHQGQRSDAVAVDQASPTEQQSTAWTSCAINGGEAAGELATRPQAPLKRLDPAFSAVSVVICEQTPRERPDGSVVLEQVERRGTQINALLVELSRPDARHRDEPCPAVGHVMPWFALVDAKGRWVRPALPLDRCGSIGQATAVLSAVETKTVATKFLRLVASAAAASSGCSQSHPDVLSEHGDLALSTHSRAGAATTDPFDGATPLRMCVYEVPSGKTANIVVGEFVSSQVLSATQRKTVVSELAKALPADSRTGCIGRSSRFAILSTTKQEGVFVELRGCNRVLIYNSAGGKFLLQASLPLLALLGQGQVAPPR